MAGAGTRIGGFAISRARMRRLRRDFGTAGRLAGSTDAGWEFGQRTAELASNFNSGHAVTAKELGVSEIEG